MNRGTGSKTRLGIIGGGQLARMSLAPATALAIDLTVLCRDFDDPAALAWPDVMIGSPDDRTDVEAVARRCGVVTFDHELVDTLIVSSLEEQGFRFAPTARVLTVAQSKLLQRETFTRLGLPIPPYAVIEPAKGGGPVAGFGAQHGWPLMVKADRGGYDGRGVWRCNALSDAEQIVGELHDRGIAAVLEKVMPFEIEVAILLARRWNGEMADYPLVETVQVDGMLRSLLAPAPVAHEIHEQAAKIARSIATSIDVVGLLAVEFFISENGLVVNEIATRPHNSGHYTIEGAITSQFEQHLRAVLDWPLGSTGLNAPCIATVNIVGQRQNTANQCVLAKALAIPGTHVHLYGKESRPGRKLGHVTALGLTPDETMERAWSAVRILEGEGVD